MRTKEEEEGERARYALLMKYLLTLGTNVIAADTIPFKKCTNLSHG